MPGAFKLKPTVCGVPRSDVSNFVESPSVLLNPARTAGANSTPLDAKNGWAWKDRYLITTGGTSVIYLDGSNTPYLISVKCDKTGLVNSDEKVRVVVTLVKEFGVFGLYVPPLNIELLNEVYDFGAPADGSMSRTLDRVTGTEQSPDGSEVLLNVEGHFRTGASGYNLKDDVRKLAGILKVDISGTVGDGGGLSAALSLYKSTEECSPSVDAGTVISTAAWKHWEETVTFTYDGSEITPDGFLGLIHKYQNVYFTKDTQVSVVGGYGLSDVSFLDGSFKEGDDTTRYEQNIVLKAYFDNDGAIHELGVNLSRDDAANYAETFSFFGRDSSYTTYYFPRYGAGVYPGEGEYGLSHRTELRDISDRHRRQVISSNTTYTISPTIDGAEKESKSYVYTSNVDETATDVESVYNPTGYATYVNANGTFNPIVNPFWNAGSTTEMVRFPPVVYMGNDSKSFNYSDTDWGVVVNPLSTAGVTNQGFSDMEVKITGNRWVSLENLRTGARTAAYSGYGQTPDNHKDNIGYDPYDDLIIDYD